MTACQHQQTMKGEISFIAASCTFSISVPKTYSSVPRCSASRTSLQDSRATAFAMTVIVDGNPPSPDALRAEEAAALHYQRGPIDRSQRPGPTGPPVAQSASEALSHPRHHGSACRPVSPGSPWPQPVRDSAPGRAGQRATE